MARHRRPWSLWSYVLSLRARRTSSVRPAHRGAPSAATAWGHGSDADRLGDFAEPAATLRE